MKAEDFERMDSPAAAFYMLALAEALVGMAGGVYIWKVPKEVQAHATLLVEYFRAQLPEGGFTVARSDWME